MKSISRSKLYARVWWTPLNSLARECGMSSSQLTEDCRLYRVPPQALDETAARRLWAVSEDLTGVSFG